MSIRNLEELFHDLVDLPASEREERLDEIGRDDPTLRRELASLIGAFASSPAFLRPPEATHETLPATLRKYRIVREIGRGAAGVVYLAEDPDLGRTVAIKTLALRSAGGASGESLREEARALAAVTHPNIAQVYSIETVEPAESPGDSAGTPSGDTPGRSAGDAPAPAPPLSFLTMEYVPGHTLAERLREGALPLEVALDIARQVSAALEAAHARSIVHRDLKPANIRVTGDGWVKVLDFGLATLVSPDSDAPKAAGTPGYMSPEQCRGESIDARSDLWSFGAVLYECLSGVPATPGESLGELIDANRRGTVDLGRLPSSVPARVAALLQECLAADPARRIARATSARSLLEDELLLLRVGSAPPRPRRGNLPRPLAAFVGRSRLLDELTGYLRDRRLVTLTGPGGVGKTRTAVEAAARVDDALEGGSWFIDLSDLTQGEDVPAAVARVLQVRDVPAAVSPEIHAQAIARRIAGERALFLLDNCEHLVEATAAFAEEMLAGCPGLVILATSRQPLGIEGEEVVSIAPLELPREERLRADGSVPASSAGAPGSPAGAGPADQATQRDASEAVELFLRRARGSLPAAGLGPEDLAVVREICRHVDGLPLAIELAASHVRSLPLPEILRRIAGGESLPDLPSRRPARHRSLRDLVDWSYRLLPAAERTVLRRLSVFRGGCTLADAEAICAGSGIEASQVYERVVRLVERSLVEPDADLPAETGGPARSVRYRLIESIRVFAAGRLQENEPERREVETLYLDHLARIATQRPEEEGPTSSAWVRRIEPDYANLLHGLDLSVARGDLGRAFVIGGRASRYWIQTGYWSEGLQRLERLLAGAPDSAAEAGPVGADTEVDADADAAPRHIPAVTSPPHPRDRAEVMGQAGRLAAILGQREKAEELTTRAVAAARALGEPLPLAHALHTGGVAAWFRTDIGAARALFEEALQLFEAVGDRGGRATCLANLGAAHAVTGDHETALGYHRGFLVLCRELGDRLAEAKGLLNLGRTEIMLGRPEQARAWLEEALAINAQNRDPASMAMTHHHLGDLELAQGRLDQSRAHLLESARIRAGLGDLAGATSVLTSLARAIDAAGDPMRAAEIAACILRHYASGEVPQLPGQRNTLEEWQQALGARIGSTAMALAVVRGESRSVADLVAWVAESATGERA